MANYQSLKAAINAVIKANGNKEITGTVLNETLTAMVNSLGADYQFAGVATPSTNPGTPDQNVFYLAGKAGTYTNFNSIVLPNGVSILKWNGSWSSETVAAGDGIFDISAYKETGGKLATFADLSAALDGGNNIPSALRKGGMSVKFIQSSDNNYIQARLMANAFTTDITKWQVVDDEPTAGSDNLVTSGCVATMDYFAFEPGSFKSDGTEQDGSYYQRVRARSVLPVKVKFGDCIDFAAFDGVKFSWYVEFWDSQDSYIGELDSNWRNDNIKRYITQGDGTIRILVKKNDGVDFTKEDIRSLRGSFSIIKRQTNILFDSLHVSIERGTMDDGAIDNKNNPTIRVRSGLYDCKLSHSNSIINIIETVDSSPLTYVAYLLDEDGIYKSRLTPNWTSGDLTVNEKGFVRFLFKKGDNASISDTDLQNISKGISVQGKDYVGIDAITDELNVKLSQGNPQPLAMKLGYIDNNGNFVSTTNKAVTDYICVSPNDRFYIMSSGIGSPVFRIAAVSYYTEKKEFLYTETILNYLPYTVSRNGFVRVQIIYSTGATISINDTNNVLYLTQYNSYVFGANDYYFNSWESGRIKTDGTDFDWNHYCRTKLYFPVKKGDKVHIVDGVNYRYDLLRYNMDRTFIGNTGDMSKDQYITEDCLIRLSVKKSPDAAFTEQEIAEMGKMFIIQPDFDNLSVPSYYETEIEQVFDDYVSNYKKQGISYLIITDTHDDYNLETKGLSAYLQRQCAAIVRLAKRTNALFVAMLGDITSGISSKNHITDVTKCMMQILKQCGLPVFVVRGNHDDNTYISPFDERTAETTMFGDEFMARAANVGNPRLVSSSQNDANGAYYCFDFDEKKIRVIVLDDNCNYPVEYEGSYLKYTAGQANWRGIDTAQIQWFAELLENTDYDIILLDHMSLNDAIHPDGTSVGGYHGFDSMNGILNAFQNHTSYSDEVVNCDFTGKTNTIIIENSGDNHTDYGAKGTNGIVYLNTGTASPTIGEISHYIPEGGSYQSVRTANTILEALFDFVMVNPDEVVRLRFGAGSNQTIQR